MSMFSTASANVQPGRAMVSRNGYRFTTSMSMRSMPCSAMVSRCSALSRRASRPPWIFGCSVLTRPSRISGDPVCAATSVTARPDSASSRAVPPVDSKRTPRAASARANSTMPVLSDTESRAVSIFMERAAERKKNGRERGGRSGLDVVGLQLLAQRIARDAEHFRRPRLVAAGTLQGDFENRAFHAAHHHVPHVVGLGFAQVVEIALQAGAHAVFQDIFLAHCVQIL